MTPPATSAPLLAALRTALAGISGPVAVALSGGMDSAMLAVHAAALVADKSANEPTPAPRSVRLFHVHHGLHAAADGWAQQVQTLAAQLALPLDIVRVAVDTRAGLGVEAAARQARYQALATLARQHGVVAVLLAHHRDDQAETVLLRLLRGTGPVGIAGMAHQTVRDTLPYLRPWLAIDRRVIRAQAQRWAQATGWQPVQDPSNLDPRYGRGALRTQLTPALDKYWPGWQDRLARHARQAADAAALLDDLARADFAALAPSPDGLSFSLAAWRNLSCAHQALVLRHWFVRHGVPMPTEAKLAELMRQLQQLHALGHDRHMQLTHAGAQVRCLRGRVVLDLAAQPSL